MVFNLANGFTGPQIRHLYYILMVLQLESQTDARAQLELKPGPDLKYQGPFRLKPPGETHQSVSAFKDLPECWTCSFEIWNMSKPKIIIMHWVILISSHNASLNSTSAQALDLPREDGNTWAPSPGDCCHQRHVGLTYKGNSSPRGWQTHPKKSHPVWVPEPQVVA